MEETVFRKRLELCIRRRKLVHLFKSWHVLLTRSSFSLTAFRSSFIRFHVSTVTNLIAIVSLFSQNFDVRLLQFMLSSTGNSHICIKCLPRIWFKISLSQRNTIVLRRNHLLTSLISVWKLATVIYIRCYIERILLFLQQDLQNHVKLSSFFIKRYWIKRIISSNIKIS